MNKIFKVIWSHVTQTFVVVSELTRSKSKAKASVSDVKKNEVSSLITSGFKLSAISALLISTIPTAYAAVAINDANMNPTIPSGKTAKEVDKAAYAEGTQSIAIGVNAGKQRPDGDKGSDADDNTTGQSDNDYEKLSTQYLNDNTRKKNNLISMGTYAFAAGHDSIAIGTNAQAVYENNFKQWNASRTNNSKHSNNGGAVAIGFQAISRGDQSVALGSRAAARNRQSVAIGNDSFASGVGSVVIGGDDSSYVPESTFLNGSKDYGGYKVETGFNPNPDKNYAPWYRPSAASGNGATVVGVHSQALSKGSTAVGVAATSGDGGKTSLVRDDSVEGGIQGFNPNENIEATAVGALAHAQNRNTTAVGHAAHAIGEYSTSVGDDAKANGKNSSAVGKSATANGNFAIAIGNAESNNVEATKTQANGTRAIAVGTTAKAEKDNSIAIGTGAKALNKNTISIGTGNTVTGANSTAIGDPTTISGTGSHSLGNDNTIPDDNSTVIGNNNKLSEGDSGQSTSDGSHVVGNNVKIRGENSLAFGNNAMVGDANNEGVPGTVNATAIGTSATAKGANALAVGTGAKASQANNTAIGTSATVTKDAGEDNIAFGSGATVTRGKNNVVIGKGSQADSLNGSSIAIGDNATISNGVEGNAYVIGTNASIASTKGGIAFGNGAKITNSNGGDGSSVAIGEGAVATGTRAISLGYMANTEGNQVDSIAIGSSAKTSGNNNIAIGNNATAQGNQAEQIVIGTGANASGTSQYSIVMGSGAGATREHSTVLGSKANSSVDGGVALGANSVSDRQAGGSATGHASTNNPYIPGTADPAQIEAINKTKGTTGAVSVGSSTVKRQITNLAAGAEDTDAVNVAQLKAAVTTAVASSTWNIKENTTPKDEVKSGDNVSFSDGTGTTATVEVADSGKTSTVKYSVNKSELSVTGGTVTAGKAGDNFATAEDVAKAINDSEKTSSVVSSTKTIEVTSKVSGNNTEYDLDLSEATKTSLGKADTALQSWEAQANGNKVKTVNKDNATLNFVNGTNIEVTNDNGQVKIATVKAPTFTTVNAENFTTGTVSITDNGINAGNQKITNLANGTANSDAVTLAQLNASKSVVKAGNNTHVRTETVTDGSTVYTVDANATTVSGSNALNITKSDAGNNVTNYALDLSDKTKGEIKQGVDANTTVNTKGLTFTADSGTDTLRKLGETLAINGDATLINTKVEAGKVSVVATKTLTDAVTNATSALQSIVTTADSKDAQTVNKDSNKANFISGTNIQLTGTKEGITVATKENVDFTTVNATTVNATTVNGDTIKSGDIVITKDGINAGNQTISNVKDGTISENSKEAVNGSQLYATNQNVTNNTNNIAKNATDIAKGTVYAGDVGNSFARPLGETTNVKGGAKDNLSDNNIGVVSDGTDTLTVKLAKTLTDLTSAEFGEKDSSDKTVINKDGVSSEVIGKDGNVISSTDLTSDGVTSETVIPEVKTTSTNTADDGTTTQTDTTTDGLDTNEVSSQGMTVSTSTTETKTTTVTPKDGTTGPEITTVETDTLKTTGVDNDGIRINTHETVTTTNPDGTTNVVENGGEVSLTSSGLNNGGNRAINVAAGVNATDAVNVSQLEEARTHYYSVNTKTEQANFNNDTATGENSIAAGPNVWAQGVQSAVFGSMAGASSDKATAVGNDAWALGVQSTAIGSGVVAGGKGSIVIGNAENTEKTVSTAEAENSVAIGTHAVVTKADAVAIGHNSGAVNVNTTAIGSGANASGERSTALGNKASSSGNNATALGVEANASGQESNVLGYKANSNGYRAMALGTLSNAAGTMAIALGSQSNASGIKAQAFGSNAIASAEDAIAMGSNANANAVSGVALGNRSMASGVSGVALGDGAASNAQQSISIGKSARTTATNSIALGNASLATADSAIAMGNSSSAVGSNGIAVGAKSKALKDNAIALGNNATVTANNALALGLNSVAYSDNAIVLGTTSKATGSHSVAIGTGASAYRQNSIAMGKDSSTGGDFAVALGDSANAAAENTLALGKNAIADKKDSVALGNNAYTGDVIATESATLAGKEYKFAGTAPVGTVSIGSEGKERTITNVAAGRISSTSTDAINGSQLYAVSEVASRGWNIQANGDTASQVAPGATVQFIDGTNIDITRDGNNITIATATNVVTTDTDKYVTGGTVVYNDKGEATATLTGNNGAGGAITGVKNNFVTKSETVTDGKKATLTRNDGGTVDIDLTNTVNQAVTEATDKGTKYAGDKADTGAAANEFGRKLGETTNVKGGAQGELSDNNIGVVSNGVDTLTVKLAKALSGLTSATFGSDATDQTVINKDGVTINSTTPDKTVSLTETGLNNGGNKITNVAEGKAGTDAVNVDQLTKAITDSAYNWNISDGTNNTAVPDSGTVAVKGSANADSANTVGVVTELEGTNVKVDLSQKAKDDIANGQKHSSVAGDTNFVVTQTTTNPEGGKQYDIKLADKVVIGKDKPVTIDGTNGTVSGLTNTTWDPNTTYTGGQAATQEQLKSVSDVVQNGWNIQANTDTATKVAPGDTVKFIDGENIKITRAGNDITVATAKDVKFDSVKVGDKVSINNDGINAGDTKVTNVTNGTLAADSKDAVNGSQLYATNQNVTNNAANITKNADNIAKGTVYAGDRLDAAVTGKTNNFTRALGEQTNVVGGATGELSDNNLAVISNGTDTLTVKLAKSLTDLTNATFGSTDTDKTVINKDGVTISSDKPEKEVSLTDKGLNNGNNQITNVTSGLVKRDGSSVELSKAEGDVLTNAVNVGDLKTTVTNLTEEGKGGGFGLTAEDNKNVKADLGKTVKVQGDGSIKTTIVEKDGQSALQVGLTENVTVGGQDKPGTITVKGENGKDGVAINGKDGAIGINGKDGSNGSITVKQGKPGVDGKDGETKTRIVYETKDETGKPTTEEVATLKDGLKFVGDTGEVIAKKLNETLAIKGNLTATAAVTDKNLRVDNENGQLIVKMAKSLTDLTNATFGSDNSNTTIGGNGVTITPKGGDASNTVSLTDKGLNNGNNQVTNVSTGLKDRDGNNVTLANASGDVLNNAVNVGDLKDSVNNLTNATTGGFGLTDEKGNDVKADLGKTVTVRGDGSVKTEVVEKDGKKALQIGLTNNVTVGNDKEPGTITVKGENGKDGVSISGKDGISIKGENGQDAVSINGKDGNGAIAVNGKDGKTGVGLDGANGTIGINGKDGSNGTITLAKGEPGVDGKDGKTRIVYETKTPDGKTVTEEVATLKDGLKFVGNDGKVITKELNETLTIKGNLSTAADVTDKNLRVDNVDNALIIKMARTLTDLTNATFTNAGGDKSVVDGNGLTITPSGNASNTVSLTTTGLNNGDNKVINVAAGDVNANSTDAVNGSQLYAVSEVANKGWNIQTNGSNTTNVKPGDTVNFANGKNIAITNDGTKVTVGLAKDVDLGKDGSIKAGDTFVNKDGVKVGDNVSLTKDGLKAGNVTISATTGINAGNKQITNVASGLGGKKLSEAKGDTLTNAANIGDLQTAVSSVTDASQGGGFGLADDKGANVTQNLGKTIAVKGDGKNISTVVKGGALTVNLNKDVDLGNDGSLTAGGTKVSEQGVSFADSLVNLTSNGLDNGGNKVTNVKAGDVNANSTDAVNGSQLYATNQNVTNVQNEVAKGWNIEAGTVDGGKVFNASKTKVAMGDTVGVKAGKNIEITLEITQDGSNIAIATSANPTFETVTTESVKVGKGDNTVAIETVTDKHGSALKVSGADGKSETRINNVADGKADNDAVNVRQLRGVAQNVANIDNRVSKLDKRVRGIGANAAAASSLPQVYIPGKSMVALAGGAYSGASAVAVGYSRASDNGKVILKVNGTANSAGHYSGGVGVGYQW
ncbi:YadA-like family protein [Actinobacillus pleuropneumoniae]|uniref:YadA-like family protein n=1 Tax=Actinobacillus pleuropneumoniae TaxID=715 RepID=UPI003F7B6B01